MQFTRRSALKQGAGAAALALGGASCGRSRQQAAEENLSMIDAVETALRISRGDLTATEATAAAIERAERIDPLLNAIVTETFDAARVRAEALDADKSGGPWRGVPSFVKDLNNVVGVRTGFGSRAFAEYVADHQFPFVDKFFANGLVSLGKSSTPEFGLTATTEPLAEGPTRNPWNLDHSTGGSSGGAAALVAAGIVPIAHASDGGGSIRIPASCCGLVGLKPSRGRIPSASDQSAVPLVISVHGVVSRSVRDTAAFMAMTETSTEESGLPEVGLVTGPSDKRLKIGFYTDAPAGTPVAPDVVAAIEGAAQQCAALGHEVIEISAPFNAALNEDFLLYWASGAQNAVARWEEMAGRRAGYDDFEPLTMGLIAHYERGKGQMEQAVNRLLSFEGVYARAFGDFDVLLSPVLAAAPPEIGYLATDHLYDLVLERVVAYAGFTGLHNVAGAPAISLPLGQSEKGLPVGAMFAAKKGEERTLLNLAFELEEAAPWGAVRPPVYA